jgi:acyl carrier protein
MIETQEELHEFLVHDGALCAGPVDADEDLIRRGVVDSLGVQQLIDFCERRYRISICDADLVPENFRSLRALAQFVERKRLEPQRPPRRLRIGRR